MRNARASQHQITPPKPPGRKWVLVLFVIVGLILHAPFLAIPATWLFSDHTAQTSKKRVVMIHRASRMRNRRTRKVLRRIKRKRRLTRLKKRPLKKKKEPKKKKPKPRKIPGQVVDVAPTPDDRPPKKTRFLSEHNTRVKKQTVSRHRKLKYKRAAPKRLRTRRTNPRKRALVASRIYAPRSRFKTLRLTKPAPRRQKKLRKAKRVKRKKRNARKKYKRPRKQKKRRVAVTKHKQGRAAAKRQTKEVRGRRKQLSFNIGPLKLDPSLKPMYRQGASPKVPPRAVNLKPNFGTLSRISGNPAPDHIKGVAQGDATLLNSRRYVFASFFNRVKQQVAQHWNPNGAYRRRDPYGNVYGVRDRSTTVAVELHKNGKIAKITVAQSCGLSFLDHEAIRAFRAAQPFPNPPKGLLENDGKIRFKFSFFLQISSRTGFRLFR